VSVRTDLDHLPDAKRRELARVVQLLFEEFGDALALAQQSWKKQSRILKIILFGSHARGGWVDEPHTAKGYQSDYDLLIIVSHDKLTDRATYWTTAEERLIRERSVTGTLRTPVNFIVHTLAEVNTALAEGRYFFVDIARDGIALYQADDDELLQPKPKAPGEALAMAREYAEDWISSAASFRRGYQHAVDDGDIKKAIFDLHQTTERLYHGLLLVLTFYTPHTHNILFLRSQAERLDTRLIEVWPREARADRARFEKLKEAYVKARYSKHFQIDADELAWLGERVEELGWIVKQVCEDRIAELERAVADDQPAPVAQDGRG
jgi:predicted nucleotidyltransferase/HEPN domain-containing protein